jgi:hypothetical protein
MSLNVIFPEMAASGFHRSMTSDTTAANPSDTRRATGSRRTVSEEVAEDSARLLAVLGRCLAEIGIKASLTTFHKIILRGEAFHPPSRLEPELDVFWREERRTGIALHIRLTEQGGRNFYCWGVSWASSHPAGDPIGAVQVIADVVEAA